MIKNIQGDFQICISVPLNKPLISTIAIKAGIQNSETAVKFIRKNLCQDLFLSMQTFSLQPYQKMSWLRCFSVDCMELEHLGKTDSVQAIDHTFILTSKLLMHLAAVSQNFEKAFT